VKADIMSSLKSTGKVWARFWSVKDWRGRKGSRLICLTKKKARPI